MSRQQRYDLAPVGRWTETPQGFMEVEANLTRTGVLEYRQPDGSIVRELRHPDEVFHEDSLASLRGAPVTDLHPSEMVGPGNVTKVQRGHVSHDIRHDGKYVTGRLIIQDGGLICAVKRRDRKELSPGYSCEIDPTPGTWKGEPYDVVQRAIVYNHLAVGPEGWGRSGSEVSMRLDGGAVAVEIAPEQDGDGSKPSMELVTIHVDGIEYQVEKSAAPHLQKALKERADKADKQEARADAAESEAKSLQSKLDSALDPKAIEAAVRARVATETKARAILGEKETKFDGLSEREIQVKAITHLDSDFDAEGRSDAYIEGRFEGLKVKEAKIDSARNKRLEIGAGLRNDDKGGNPVVSVEEARRKANERKANAWKEDCRAHR